jgi:hypothetical protein
VEERQPHAAHGVQGSSVNSTPAGVNRAGAAAGRVGIVHSHLHRLTRGTCAPSRRVARALIAVLGLDEAQAEALLAESVLVPRRGCHARRAT